MENTHLPPHPPPPTHSHPLHSPALYAHQQRLHIIISSSLLFAARQRAKPMRSSFSCRWLSRKTKTTTARDNLLRTAAAVAAAAGAASNDSDSSSKQKTNCVHISAGKSIITMAGFARFQSYTEDMEDVRATFFLQCTYVYSSRKKAAKVPE